MSIKATAFATVNVIPQTLCNYYIHIPNRPYLSILAESTSYPANKWDSVDIPFLGRRITRPAGKATPDPWRIRISETQYFAARRELWEKGAISSDDYDFNFKYFKFDRIRVFPLSLVTQGPVLCIELLDCWIRSRDAVELAYDNMEPWKWSLEICYSSVIEPESIIDSTLNNIQNSSFMADITANLF